MISPHSFSSEFIGLQIVLIKTMFGLDLGFCLSFNSRHRILKYSDSDHIYFVPSVPAPYYIICLI